MTIEQLIAAYKAKLAEAQVLSDQWKGKENEMPEDVAKKIDGILGESDEIKVKIDLAKQAQQAQQQRGQRLQDADDFLKQSAGTQAAHLGWRQSGPSEGMPGVDPQSWHSLDLKRWVMDPNVGIVAEAVKLRFFVPEAVMSKDYPSAFEAYVRKGVARMGPQDVKTLSEGLDSAGGYLTPEDFHTELIRKTATMGAIRPNARVVQTSRDVATWPKIHYTTDDLYTSGVRLTWTGESPSSSTVHRVTEPVFGQYRIQVQTAMASLPLTNDFIEDSAFDVLGLSTDLFSEAFTLGEDDVFVNGSGVTRPRGILADVDDADLNGPRSVVSGTAATLLADGIVDLTYALPAQYERNAKFYFAKGTEKVIRKLKDGQNNYIWPIWPQMGGLSPAPRELMGYPTVRDEFVPAVTANAYPIIYGDVTGYLVLDRVGFSVQRLEELYAETNITLLLARRRVGGLLVQPWRLKVQKVSA